MDTPRTAQQASTIATARARRRTEASGRRQDACRRNAERRKKKNSGSDPDDWHQTTLPRASFPSPRHGGEGRGVGRGRGRGRMSTRAATHAPAAREATRAAVAPFRRQLAPSTSCPASPPPPWGDASSAPSRGAASQSTPALEDMRA